MSDDAGRRIRLGLPEGVAATHAPRPATPEILAEWTIPADRPWAVGGTLWVPRCPTCGAPVDSAPKAVYDGDDGGWRVVFVPVMLTLPLYRRLPCGHEWPRGQRWSVYLTTADPAEPTTPGSRVWARRFAGEPRELFVLAPMFDDASSRPVVWVPVDRADRDDYATWADLADVLVEHRAPEVVPVEDEEVGGDGAHG